MTKFPDHVVCWDGVWIGAVRYFPSQVDFLNAIETDGGGEETEYEVKNVHLDYVRGCICSNWDSFDASRFHWEYGANPKKHRGLIKVWRYGTP